MLQVASNCRWQSAKLPDINTTYIWESPLKFNHLSHSHSRLHSQPADTCNRVEFNAICCSHQSNCCQSMADATRMSANNFATILRNLPRRRKASFSCGFSGFTVWLQSQSFGFSSASIHFNPQLNYYCFDAKGFFYQLIWLWFNTLVYTIFLQIS